MPLGLRRVPKGFDRQAAIKSLINVRPAVNGVDHRLHCDRWFVDDFAFALLQVVVGRACSGNSRTNDDILDLVTTNGSVLSDSQTSKPDVQQTRRSTNLLGTRHARSRVISPTSFTWKSSRRRMASMHRFLSGKAAFIDRVLTQKSLSLARHSQTLAGFFCSIRIGRATRPWANAPCSLVLSDCQKIVVIEQDEYQIFPCTLVRLGGGRNGVRRAGRKGGQQLQVSKTLRLVGQEF